MSILTTNLLAEYVAKLAKNGTAPGENSTPTSTWADLIGSNDGTISGPDWTETSGWDGDGSEGDPYCLVLDSSDLTRVDLPDLGVTEDKTYGLEVWAAYTGTTWSFIVGEGTAAAGGVGRVYLNTCDAPAGTVILYSRNDAYTNTGLDGILAYNNGAFRHIFATSDGTNTRLYVDGSEIGTPGTQTGTYTLNKCSIGCTYQQSDTPSQWFNGKIATVRLYSGCPTAGDVAGNYAMGVTASSIDPSGFTGLTVIRDVSS